MMIDTTREAVRAWVVSIFAEAINRRHDPEQRLRSVSPRMKTIGVFVRQQRARQTSAKTHAATRNQTDSAPITIPHDAEKLRKTLLEMDPFKFERHTMGFFEAAGLEAWVTRKSNDLGVDGFAIHPDGLIITQCKRNAPDNKVGRPMIQQFKGVMEEQKALRGYVVTTSTFTGDARRSAELSDKLTLIDIDELVRWHASPPSFA
jgi:restriction system protein